jgi:hypothetical protein
VYFLRGIVARSDGGRLYAGRVKKVQHSRKTGNQDAAGCGADIDAPRA